MNKKILSLSVLILLGVLVISVVSASWLTGNAISSKKTVSIGRDSLVTLDSGKYIVVFGTSSTASLGDVSIYRAVGSTRGSLIQRLELEKGDIKTLTSLPLQIAFTRSSNTGGVNNRLKFYFTLSDVVCASGESWSNGECVSEDWETEDEEVTYQGVIDMFGEGKMLEVEGPESTLDCVSVCHQNAMQCAFGEIFIYADEIFTGYPPEWMSHNLACEDSVQSMEFYETFKLSEKLLRCLCLPLPI